MDHFKSLRENQYTISSSPSDRTVDEAKLSAAAGYEFPPLPAGNRWSREFDEFATKCFALLELRGDDASLLDVNVSDRLHRNYFDALIEFRSAATARDIHLIRVYHRLLLESPDPALIRMAVPALRAFDPKAVLTHEHVAACMEINRSLSAWCDKNPALFTDMWDVDEHLVKLLKKLARLCFEEMSPERVSMICMLVRRGVVESGQVRAALADFENVTPVLMEGAL